MLGPATCLKSGLHRLDDAAEQGSDEQHQHQLQARRWRAVRSLANSEEQKQDESYKDVGQVGMNASRLNGSHSRGKPQEETLSEEHTAVSRTLARSHSRNGSLSENTGTHRKQLESRGVAGTERKRSSAMLLRMRWRCTHFLPRDRASRSPTLARASARTASPQSTRGEQQESEETEVQSQ